MTPARAGQSQRGQRTALFSFGFRPFFLSGAIWAVLAMLLWLTALSGAITLPTRFDPVSWHAHEFLFGYLGAVLAGFLLTAVPNWTGRLPMVGWPLVTLFALWVSGRLVIFWSALLPGVITMAADLSFPLALLVVVLREIIAGRHWRNLVVLALLVLFILANGIFHLEAMTGAYPAQGYGLRLGLATAVMIIALIGGRIIPSFTRNWLARTGRTARPSPPMQKYDKLVLLASVLILALWVARPSGSYTASCLLVFGLLHLVRLLRWQGHQTLTEPLVWVLHVSYAFIPAGAAALGIRLATDQDTTVAAQHLWMSGAIGSMTLAVMTRATLGHTGKELTADRGTVIIYLCLFGSVLARVASSPRLDLSSLSGILWLAAFGGFAVIYGPLLARPRRVQPDPQE
ncbi:NnrS family protein [Roseobacter ponti]|uniref:NnrS family protein n=1 Tax=Roseobacter ponti TaxID=1891787 RepID=A0A858SQL6_9RHOB|nr:NnrS family protein [Roseobacter ponti]QJF50297.1 NnrS family protein [Roseobacter ponti]